MLHKLDGFIWLAAVSVDCYGNALQHNGLGQILPDTVARTHAQSTHIHRDKQHAPRSWGIATAMRKTLTRQEQG